MLSTIRSPDHPHQKSLLIKHDDQFFSRLLSREMSMKRTTMNGSFRGTTPSSVPFTWESQPGTPKHHSYCETSALPPLTPPPSYYSSTPNPIKKQKHNSSFRSSPIHTLFLKLNIRKQPIKLAQPSSPSVFSYCSTTSSCSSSISSSISAPMTPSANWRSRLGSWSGSSSSSSSKVDDEDNGFVGSRTYTLCFRIRRQRHMRSRDLQKKPWSSMIPGSS